MFHLYNFMLLQGCSKPLTDTHLFLLSGAAVASASSQLTYHPIGSWSDHPPSLTFISPNPFFWRKQNIFASQNSNFTFFYLKTPTLAVFPRLLLLRSFGLAFGISLWSRQQKGTTHMKQLQTKVNRNSTKKTKKQRDPLFKSEAKMLRISTTFFLFPSIVSTSRLSLCCRLGCTFRSCFRLGLCRFSLFTCWSEGKSGM